MNLYKGLIHASIISSLYLTYRYAYNTNEGSISLLIALFFILVLYIDQKSN